MEIKDKLTLIVAIAAAFIALVTPFLALYVTGKVNERKERFKKKQELFLTLFARRGISADYIYVDALNQIEIVFSDSPEVLRLSRIYIDKMTFPDGRKATDEDVRNWDFAKADLLQAIASKLGYSRLKQTEILKYYMPGRHVDLELHNEEWRKASLAYYQSALSYHEVANEMCHATIAFYKELEKQSPQELPKLEL